MWCRLGGRCRLCDRVHLGLATGGGEGQGIGWAVKVYIHALDFLSSLENVVLVSGSVCKDL